MVVAPGQIYMYNVYNVIKILFDPQWQLVKETFILGSFAVRWEQIRRYGFQKSL